MPSHCIPKSKTLPDISIEGLGCDLEMACVPVQVLHCQGWTWNQCNQVCGANEVVLWSGSAAFLSLRGVAMDLVQRSWDLQELLKADLTNAKLELSVAQRGKQKKREGEVSDLYQKEKLRYRCCEEEFGMDNIIEYFGRGAEETKRRSVWRRRVKNVQKLKVFKRQHMTKRQQEICKHRIASNESLETNIVRCLPYVED